MNEEEEAKEEAKKQTSKKQQPPGINFVRFSYGPPMKHVRKVLNRWVR